MSTKPFRIEKAGLYITRDGRTVEVTAYTREMCRIHYDAGHRWSFGPHPHHCVTGAGRFLLSGESADDIIAKAPAPPATKPHPAKGKKLPPAPAPETTGRSILRCRFCWGQRCVCGQPQEPAPEPAKGKKAKRRYTVGGGGPCGYAVYFSRGASGHCVAASMSRADARAFAAMKEAQRGGK